MNRIIRLFKRDGIVLSLIRLPSKMIKTLLNKINTFFWTFFLKEMGKKCLIEFGVKIENPKQLILKDNVYIGSNTVFGSENTRGLCILEDGVHIGRNCRIDHTGNVEISEDTLLSAEVAIFSHSHGYNPYSDAVPKNIFIGKKSWVGYRAILLESVEFIASRCIISAGAVVTKKCADKNSIYGGVPAKKIKEYRNNE